MALRKPVWLWHICDLVVRDGNIVVSPDNSGKAAGIASTPSITTVLAGYGPVVARRTIS